MAGSIGKAVATWEKREEKETAKAVNKYLRGNMAKAGDVVKASVKDMLGGSSVAAEGAPPGKDTGGLQKSIMRRTYGGANPGFIVIPRDAKHKDQLGRLQKGFTGTDKRGRTYRQKPRKFTGRALDRVKGEVLQKVIGS